MGILHERFWVVAQSFLDRIRHGLPVQTGVVKDELLFILNGVGGFQFSPLMIRRMVRTQGVTLPTEYFRWQYGLPFEIWSDLMWLRRNRVQGAKVARRLLALKREFPDLRLHVIAYSGGAGIGVFACEALKGRAVIDTLILAAPALSRHYNLSSALRAVARCVVLVSPADNVILGLGTRLFGTTDRRFERSAGMIGFAVPHGASAEDQELYDRKLREIHWSRDAMSFGHHGGHTGWLTQSFLRDHLVSLLHGQSNLPERSVPPAAPVTGAQLTG